jgi:hypothetical protein
MSSPPRSLLPRGVLQSAYEGVAALFEQGQEEERTGRVARGIVAAWPLGHDGQPAPLLFAFHRKDVPSRWLPPEYGSYPWWSPRVPRVPGWYPPQFTRRGYRPASGLDREARGEGVPDRQRLAGCRRGLGGVPLALIHAVLTHKSEREELNLKPKPDLKSAEDCQTEPQRSTSEAEGDGTFDAAAIVTRVDTDRDFEEH